MLTLNLNNPENKLELFGVTKEMSDAILSLIKDIWSRKEVKTNLDYYRVISEEMPQDLTPAQLFYVGHVAGCYERDMTKGKADGFGILGAIFGGGGPRFMSGPRSVGDILSEMGLDPEELCPCPECTAARAEKKTEAARAEGFEQAVDLPAPADE